MRVSPAGVAELRRTWRDHQPLLLHVAPECLQPSSRDGARGRQRSGWGSGTFAEGQAVRVKRRSPGGHAEGITWAQGRTQRHAEEDGTLNVLETIATF